VLQISKGSANPCGFTLLELIAVIFVLSLVLAVIMPSFSSPGGKLKSEARRIATTMRFLYETAVSKKQETSIEFELEKKEIAWDTERRKGSEKFKAIAGVEIPSRGLVKEGQLIVFFSPSDMNEHITVHLELGDETAMVVFNPVSGRTKVIGPEKKIR
jgi:prepilin-type N-terminal cleavage/methylation domain-containing protein